MLEKIEPERMANLESRPQGYLPLAPCALTTSRPAFYSSLLCPPRSALCVFLRNFAFFIFHFALCIVLFTPVAFADISDFLSKFHPSLTIQEEYTDNFYLTSSNRQEDWITTISPGIRFSTLPARATTPGQILQAPAEPWGMDLDYRLGLVYHAKIEENDYISHEGTLNAWYTFNRRLTLRLRDYFIRSEEPREREFAPGALPEQFLLAIQRERAIYIRNVLEPSIGYQFGREDRFDLNYRNMIYENESPRFEDSKENHINPRLTYFFNIRNGVLLEYGLTFGNFERSPDMVGHMARARYTYRFNPQTAIFVEYTFLKRDFESPGIDYEVQNPAIGIEHAFTSTLSGRAQLGYFWQNPQRRSSTGGFTYEAGLTQRAERTTYTLLLQGGYTESFFMAENLGFVKYHRVIGTITHRLVERITLGVSGTVERAEYTFDRKDWTWAVRGNGSYQIFRWLVLSIEALTRENDSNVDGADYKENRFFLRLTATI